MDCQIIDLKIVLRAGSLVSVTPNRSGDNNCKDRYFGIVLRLTQDYKAHVKWFENDTVSIEDLVLLTLEVEVPKREKPKFTLRIKPNPELCVILKYFHKMLHLEFYKFRLRRYLIFF